MHFYEQFESVLSLFAFACAKICTRSHLTYLATLRSSRQYWGLISNGSKTTSLIDSHAREFIYLLSFTQLV